MNYASIKKFDIANGLGVRVSLFVSGCTHHCKNCFNAIAWDFHYGNPFTIEVEDEIIKSLKAIYDYRSYSSWRGAYGASKSRKDSFPF